VRDMTDDEHYAFDGEHEHSDLGGDVACCPSCVERVALLGEPAEEDPRVASCSKCGTEFVVWMEMVPRVYSAKLPG
jgi:hypothetical protein